MRYKTVLNRVMVFIAVLGVAMAMGVLDHLHAASALKDFFSNDSKSPVLAKMGSLSLTLAEFQRLMNYSDPEVQKQLLVNPELMKQKIRESLLRKALVVKAESAKWDERPEVVFLMQRAKEGLLVEHFLEHTVKPVAGFPDDALVKKTYEENQEKLHSLPAVNIAQIFLQYKPNGTEKEKQEIHKIAEKYIGWINKGDADFSTLAKKYSNHKESAAQGGDMGWVEVPQLLSEFKQALDGMKVGDVKGPIESAQGLHIIKLIAFKEAEIKPYEAVRDALAQLLIKKKFQENKDAYLKELVDKQPITLHEDQLSHIK